MMKLISCILCWGYRSALAAKTLKDIGFNSIFNIGGYEEWIQMVERYNHL